MSTTKKGGFKGVAKAAASAGKSFHGASQSPADKGAGSKPKMQPKVSKGKK